MSLIEVLVSLLIVSLIFTSTEQHFLNARKSMEDQRLRIELSIALNGTRAIVKSIDDGIEKQFLLENHLYATRLNLPRLDNIVVKHNTITAHYNTPTGRKRVLQIAM